MALPTEIKNDAIALVASYCATKIPSQSTTTRSGSNTRSAATRSRSTSAAQPWREDFGPDWTSMRICSMQWDPKTELWTLYARNRNDRRLDYPFIEPTPSVKLLGVK